MSQSFRTHTLNCVKVYVQEEQAVHMLPNRNVLQYLHCRKKLPISISVQMYTMCKLFTVPVLCICKISFHWVNQIQTTFEHHTKLLYFKKKLGKIKQTKFKQTFPPLSLGQLLLQFCGKETLKTVPRQFVHQFASSIW